MTTGPAALVREVGRVLRRRRGPVAALLVAAAVATALPGLAPAAAPAAVVLAAAHDLAPGSRLTEADVVRVALPAAARPSGALPLGPVEGLRVAGPVRRGEPLTDVRLLGPGLLDPASARAGLVAVPVRLADRGGAALLAAGDSVDVLAAAGDGRAPTAAVVAADATVLAVPAPDGTDEGGLVVLRTSSVAAGRLAAAAVSGRLSVVLRPGTTG